MASEPDPPELDAEWFKNARRHRGGVPIDPAPEAVREIARRLRQPVYTEETMRRWDSWRVYIAKGGGGSWPRDAFEALLDAVDIERGEAADLLLSLRQVADYEREVAEAEIAGRKAAEASLKTAIRLLRDINEDTAVPWIHEEITAFLAAWKARYE
jgi:hypothetical protein